MGGNAKGYKGVFDLVRMKSIIWNSETKGAVYEESDAIPDDMKEQVEKYRAALVERAAEQDDDLIEKFLKTGDLSEEELKSCIRKGTLSFSIVPVLCGSAFKNKGVQT